MSRFGIGIGIGIWIVAVALSAALTAQTTGAQQPGQADAKSIQTAPPIPWLDPSLANRPDRAAMLAIAVATVRECSAGSSAVCYGFCAPSPDDGSDHANREQPAGRESAPIKPQNAIKSKPTVAIIEN
ncbi:MAG: hypothetical protein ABSF93_05985 [Candidatus Sulfotelmatobacter sp.]|jgi:hypothetical protein